MAYVMRGSAREFHEWFRHMGTNHETKRGQGLSLLLLEIVSFSVLGCNVAWIKIVSMYML